MTTNDVIRLAQKHLPGGAVESSAHVCLADAIRLFNRPMVTVADFIADLDAARARALKSLAYSVGIMHPDYRRAAKA